MKQKGNVVDSELLHALSGPNMGCPGRVPSLPRSPRRMSICSSDACFVSAAMTTRTHEIKQDVSLALFTLPIRFKVGLGGQQPHGGSLPTPPPTAPNNPVKVTSTC